MNPNQIRRPPSASKGGKEDAERRAYREAERAQMLAKRVEQTMMKVRISILHHMNSVTNALHAVAVLGVANAEGAS